MLSVSIVTPSFRQSHWLNLCLASVADQGLPVEHIVQDAGSDDGTLDWLPRDPRARAFIEKDDGMYDAVNRGLRRAQGEILAYLNCDEQYLPGTLAAVTDFFARHPQTDILFGDVVMVGPAGDYLWHRKMQVPLKHHTWTCHLSTLTCATFFRRQVFERDQFNTAWRDAGDAEWMLRLMQRGTRMDVLGRFTSAFTQTGANMSAATNARQENRLLAQSAPSWARNLSWALVLHHRLRRWCGGMYRQKPFAYELYTRSNPAHRTRFEVTAPRFRPPRPL